MSKETAASRNRLAMDDHGDPETMAAARGVVVGK